tara:strand:- start:166172 stop:166651 length:480 start_codon:yes stop_codon:yes gene_type:complete
MCFSLLFLYGSCSKEDNPIQETAIYDFASNPEVEFEKDQQYENDLLQAVNELLVSSGQTPLIRNYQADDVAFDHTLTMIEANTLHHNHFSERQAYFNSIGFQGVRENVGKGYSNPSDLIAAWLQSDEHKSAIESNSTHTGISVLKNEDGVYFITQIYLK